VQGVAISGASVDVHGPITTAGRRSGSAAGHGVQTGLGCQLPLWNTVPPPPHDVSLPARLKTRPPGRRISFARRTDAIGRLRPSSRGQLRITLATACLGSFHFHFQEQ